MYSCLLAIIPLTAAVKMHYRSLVIVTTIFLILNIKCLECHLKDLGESKTNWTSVKQKMEKRILGGTEAFIEEHPYSVQFFNFGGLCGGSIITSKTILTAAHCFDSNSNLAEMKIYTKSRYIYDVQAVAHEVWNFLIHERYGEGTAFNNDIAMVVIHNKFSFGPQVQKAIITDKKFWLEGNNKDNFTVSGWGEIYYGVRGSVFRETYLHYTNRETCKSMNEIELSPEMFCLFGDGTRDTCRGDSGGGVVWRGELVGIVSHGRGCGPTPGVYINVYYYKSWINNTTKKLYQEYCKFHK